MKRPLEYTTEELLGMPKETLDRICQEWQTEIDAVELERQKIFTRKHELCLSLKKRGPDYTTFQKQAYELNMEYDRAKKTCSEMRTEEVRMKRDWQAANEVNQQVSLDHPQGSKEKRWKTRNMEPQI